MFTGNSLSDIKLYLLYNVHTVHYNVITKLKTARHKSICITHVKRYTIHTNVTKLAPCVQLNHSVIKTRPSIVVNATGGNSIRNVLEPT